MATKEQIKHTIQGQEFTETKIREKLKEILNSPFENPEVEGTDLEFVLEAFKTARYYEEKAKGMSIVRVVRKKAERYATLCFYIYREDGTCTDFSYTKMHKNNPDRDDVLNALRQAIDPIISNFRKDFKPDFYEGVWIEDVSQADVDHYNRTFNELAWEWIRNNGGIEILIKKVNKTEDESTITYFVDESLNESFRIFHDQNTHLRFLPKSINRSKKHN